MGAAVTVRPARAGELPAIMGILDAAMLEVDASAVADTIDEEAVLVAVADDRIVGACVLEVGTATAHLEAIAVRPGRRGQGIGTALVEAAAARGGALTAEFDEDRRDFYASLGFDVEPLGDGRLRGVR